MRRLFLLFLMGLVTNSFAQGITSPSSRVIDANASNVDAGDFVISWPNNTEDLLVSLSLDYQNGATLSFPTTTGITRAYGFNSWNSVTSIVFFGKRDNVNSALAAMTLSMGSIKTAVRINVEVSSYDPGYTYNPVNKHFYRYISGVVPYATAKSNSGTYNFKGKTGYLATITTQSEQDFLNNNIVGNNIWFALTDVASEGNWRIDAGPENGTLIKTQNGQTTGNIAGFYNNWCGGEPNDASNEDYAVTKWNGGTCWNDVNGTNSSVAGYIVEISDDFPAGSGYTGVYSSYIVHNNDIAYTLNSGNTLSSATISNKPNLFGGLQFNDGHTITLPSATTLNTNKMIFPGTGKIVFTDATSKWTPGTSSTTNTFTHSPSTNSNPTYWSASSVWSGDAFGTYDGTYGHFTPWINSVQAWSTGSNTSNQWIVLNYNIPAYIAGIQTQGRQNLAQWVTTAKIEVSIDGTTWKTVLDNATMNSNQTTIINVPFPNVEYAQYVRVTPTGFYGHPSMRMGLLIKQ